MPFRSLFKRASRQRSPLGPKIGSQEETFQDNEAVAFPKEDTQSIGLHLLTPSASVSGDGTPYLADIVFVHGLNGHWSRTWTYDRNGTFWPKDLLPHTVPRARIFSYGYPSQIIGSKSVTKIGDFAKDLLGAITREQQDFPRPIIFVGHSLGGIVVAKALILAHEQELYKGVSVNTKAIMFLGTPHRGSKYASYGTILGTIGDVAMHASLVHRFVGGVRTSLIKSLERGSPELEAVSESFRSLVHRSELKIISLYETESHPFTNGLIVDKASAELMTYGERFEPLLGLNHQNMCQYRSLQDDNFVKVSNLIKLEMPKVPNNLSVESSLFSDHSFDETERRCAALLNVVSVADYEAKLDARVDGTLTWVLQKPQYSEWISDSATRLLLVTGYAGSGKTILASFISRYLNEQHPKALVCKYFCDGKIDEYRDPCTMLKSLIFQIVDQRRRLWRIVKKSSDAGGFNIFSQFDALWNLLVQLVRAETRYSIMIVIDALDELEEKAQSRLVDRIDQLLANGNIKSIKFLITTRSTAEVATAAYDVSPHTVCLSLVNSKEDIDKDIKFVVRHRLERMVRKGICEPKVRDKLEAILVAKADQTFLWIKLVLPLLEERRILVATDADEVAKISLPVSLAAVYEHLLSLIPKEDRPHASKVLRLLAVCDRALTCEEIGIMLSITSDQRSTLSLSGDHLSLKENSIQRLLGPLIRVSDSRVVLLHQSLKDYLIGLYTNDKDSALGEFGVDLIQDKRDIVQACSMYLSLEDFQCDILTASSSTDEDEYASEDGRSAPSRTSSLYGLEAFEGLMSQEVPQYMDISAWTTVRSRYPLFDYAALHWAEYYAICQDAFTERDTQRCLSLCSADTPLLRNWFLYYWSIELPLEPLPTVIDNVFVAAFFGHVKNLKRLLLDPKTLDPLSASKAVYWATRRGHTACVEIFLQAQDIIFWNEADQTSTPLLTAAQFGQLDCLKLLLCDSHVNVNAQDDSGATALSSAVVNNHSDVVAVLLANQTTDINIPNRFGNTPLDKAVTLAESTILAQLLGNRRTDIERLDRHHRSILSWAAEYGSGESISLILQTRRIDINRKDSKGRTPLSYAAQHGHLPAVKTLINPGRADPLIQDESGRNVHSWAAPLGKPDILQYLTRKYPAGADIPDHDGWTPAAWTLDPPTRLENLKVLLRHGNIDVNRPDGTGGRSLLAWVASYDVDRQKQLSMATALIGSKGIDLEARDANGRTPLSHAAGAGSLGVARALIATGKVDVNTRDRRGQTPLMWAAKGGFEDMVHLLLEYPDTIVDARDADGVAAVDIATRLGHSEIVPLLETRRTGMA